MSGTPDQLPVSPEAGDTRNPVASLIALVEVTGACGRKVVRYAEGEGRLTLIVEPTGSKPAPCTRCRRDCPGRHEAQEEERR